MKVIFSRNVHSDLREIFDFIKKHNPSAARIWVRKLQARALTLKNNPRRGAPLFDAEREIRRIREGEYLIFYAIESRVVRVLPILHGARDIDTMLGGKVEDAD